MLCLAEKLHALGRTDDCKLVLQELKGRHKEMLGLIAKAVTFLDIVIFQCCSTTGSMSWRWAESFSDLQ